jgi:hypothetical protein
MENILERVVYGGLYSTKDEEPYFSSLGCEVNIHPECRGLAGTVEDASGYASIEDAQAGPENIYEFRICSECNYFAQIWRGIDA